MDVQPLLGRSATSEFSWDETRARVYAAGVGVGSDEPLGEEIAYVTHREPGRDAVLPSFAVLPGAAARRALDLSGIDRTRVVHASQRIEVHRALRSSGRLVTTCTVVGVWDKGSGALLETEGVSVDVDSGERVVVNRSASFIRGAGGFGGDRGPAADAPPPTRRPDEVLMYPTRADQALLYCLSGDDNPLHWDPGFARTAGFERPILHGLCTFGFATRGLVATVGAGDPARIASVSARFSAPVLPGDSLVVEVWREEGGASFRVGVDGRTVLDLGSCTVRQEDST